MRAQQQQQQQQQQMMPQMGMVGAAPTQSRLAPQQAPQSQFLSQGAAQPALQPTLWRDPTPNPRASAAGSRQPVTGFVDQMGGKAVTEGMGADVLPNAGGHNAALEQSEGHLTGHLAPLTSQEQSVFVSFERDDVGAVVTQVVVNGITRLLPNGYNALFVSLSNHANEPVN